MLCYSVGGLDRCANQALSKLPVMQAPSMLQTVAPAGCQAGSNPSQGCTNQDYKCFHKLPNKESTLGDKSAENTCQV